MPSVEQVELADVADNEVSAEQGGDNYDSTSRQDCTLKGAS